MLARSTLGVIATALLAVSLAACGGDDEDPPKSPRIPAAVADRLADLSDDTAEALELGDDCAAQETADELESEMLEAEDEIPPELRRQVREGVQQLTASITCEPEPPVTVIETVPEESTEEPSCPEDEKDEKGKDEDSDDEQLPPGVEKKDDKGHKEDPCDEHGDDDEEGDADVEDGDGGPG